MLGTATDQFPDTSNLLLVREGEVGMMPEEVKKAQGFGDIESHIIPVLKILDN